MGYSTDFYGGFKLSRTATEQEKNYINTFSGTRRMKRDVNKLMELYNGKHGLPNFSLTQEQKDLLQKLKDTGLEVKYKQIVENRTAEQIYGNDGEYFAMDDKQSGQSRDSSIIDYNEAPGHLTGNNLDWGYRWKENQRRIQTGECQPSLWCQWIISDDGNLLEWDGGEKFYYYTEWLKYMIKHFFTPWEIILNGQIEWEGEDRNDRGKIIVENNKVTIKEAKIIYE